MLRSPAKFLMLSGLLFAVWLLLSGIYLPRLVVTAGVAAIVIAYFMDRYHLLDGESLPLGLIPRGLVYWAWLAKEVVKSALNVTRIILSPSLPISPTMITFTPSQKTGVGLATHGNSITLTPGTITIEISVSGNFIQVHGIERSGAEGCVDSEMNAKVNWFEGSALKIAGKFAGGDR